jgi:hypothetical protein
MTRSLCCLGCTDRTKCDVFREDVRRAANDNFVACAIIQIPPDIILRRPATVHRLAIAVRGLSVSRRSVPDFILDAILAADRPIRNADGSTFHRCSVDVDAAFNDDGSFRWVSDFLSFAETAPKQRAQARTILRLRLIYLAVAIQFPKIAEGVLA